MRKISIKAILIGSLLDISVSFLLGVFLGISIAAGIHERNLDTAASHAAIHTAMHGARWVYLAFGLMSSVLGGYVAAKIAKHDELLNGACSSVFCLAIGVFTMVRGSSIYPLWVQFLLFLLSIVCSGLGGYLWQVQPKKWGRKPSISRS